jgi:hypothetical protein
MGGFVIDSSTLSRADIFVPRGLSGVVVGSDTFLRVAEEHGFSDIKLVLTDRSTWVPANGASPQPDETVWWHGPVGER